MLEIFFLLFLIRNGIWKIAKFPIEKNEIEIFSAESGSSGQAN